MKRNYDTSDNFGCDTRDKLARIDTSDTLDRTGDTRDTPDISDTRLTVTGAAYGLLTVATCELMTPEYSHEILSVLRAVTVGLSKVIGPMKRLPMNVYGMWTAGFEVIARRIAAHSRGPWCPAMRCWRKRLCRDVEERTKLLRKLEMRIVQSFSQ